MSTALVADVMVALGRFRFDYRPVIVDPGPATYALVGRLVTVTSRVHMGDPRTDPAATLLAVAAAERWDANTLVILDHLLDPAADVAVELLLAARQAAGGLLVATRRLAGDVPVDELLERSGWRRLDRLTVDVDDEARTELYTATAQ